MKLILPALFLLFCTACVYANGEHPAAKKTSPGLHIKYLNHTKKCTHKDSVLIILDKYDRTGAGIVKQVFYPDNDRQIIIPDIPPGKYLLVIRFLGFHSEKYVKTIHIKKYAVNGVVVSLSDWDEYHR